jgi:hypothetical protein
LEAKKFFIIKFKTIIQFLREIGIGELFAAADAAVRTGYGFRQKKKIKSNFQRRFHIILPIFRTDLLSILNKKRPGVITPGLLDS